MKRLLLSLAIIFTMSAVVLNTSCREEKSTGEKIEEAVEDTGDAVEDAAEEVEDAVDDSTK